jgi:hypothetical protein
MVLKNKKGFFFSTLVIVMILLFVFTYSLAREANNRVVIQNRVKSMDNFFSTTQSDINRQLYISSYRTVIAMQKYFVQTTSHIITDPQKAFNETIMTGKLYGSTEFTAQLMLGGLGATIPNITETIQKAAHSINTNITFSNQALSLTQDNPWNLTVIYNASVILNDSSSSTSWSKDFSIKVNIPIIGLEDPSYAALWSGTKARLINKTNNYIEDPASPSYLDMLQRSTTPSPCCGIRYDGP